MARADAVAVGSGFGPQLIPKDDVVSFEFYFEFFRER
jgi:hypothetical protein